MPSSDAAASADERAAPEPSGEIKEIDERADSEPHRTEPPGKGAGGRSELGGEEDVERGKGKGRQALGEEGSVSSRTRSALSHSKSSS